MIRREFLKRADAIIGGLFAMPMIARAEKVEPDFEFKPDSLQMVPISAIKIDEKYRNKLRPPTDDEIDDLIASIKKEGLVNPLTIASDGTIVTGFIRLEAIKKLRFKRILCYVLPHDRSDAIKHANTTWNPCREISV